MTDITKDQRVVSVRPPEKGKVTRGKPFEILAYHHESEIEVYKGLIESAVKMVWMGIFLMAAGVIYSMCGDYDYTKLFATLPGGFTSLLSATTIFLISKSSENKQKYFNSLVATEWKKEMLKTIQKEKDSENKLRMIEKLIENS